MSQTTRISLAWLAAFLLIALLELSKAQMKIRFGDRTGTVTFIDPDDYDPDIAKMRVYTSIETYSPFPFTLDCFKPMKNHRYLTGFIRMPDPRVDSDGAWSWKYTCGQIAPGVEDTDCTWSDYVNDVRERLSFKCPNNQFMMGMAGTKPSDGDRRYKFKCCAEKDLKLQKCRFTKYLSEFEYVVKHGELITGVSGSWKNEDEGRNFRFRVCDQEYD